MTVLARIAPQRVSQPMSILIVDPFAVDGLEMVRVLRERGIAAQVSTSVPHGMTQAHQNKHNIVIIKDADCFTPSEVALFARLSSTRTCLVLADRTSPMAEAVRKGLLEAKIVPRSLSLSDLLGAIRWALRNSPPTRQAEPPRPKSAQPLRITHCILRPVTRKTERYVSAVSDEYRGASAGR